MVALEYVRHYVCDLSVACAGQCVTFLGFASPPVEVFPCDIGENGSDTAIRSETKRYAPQQLWGQAIFWERQTIADPGASLAAARYGQGTG